MQYYSEKERGNILVYAQETWPLLDIYGARGLLLRVDGMGDMDDVTARLLSALDVNAA